MTPEAGTPGAGTRATLKPDASPSPDELAAIVAAIEVLWPRPQAAGDDRRAGPPPWRFSGRWWNRPATARRERPWVADPR